MTSLGIAILLLIAQVCCSFAQGKAITRCLLNLFVTLVNSISILLVTLEQTSPEGSLCLGDVVTYTCAVEASHQLVWRYTVNGDTKPHPFVFDDPVTGQVFNLGPFELVLKSTEPVSSSAGNIMSTATVANGLSTAENGGVISCVGSTTPPGIMITFAG